MKKLMFILAILALGASCTPESIETNEQQINKKDYYIPPNG